MVDDLIKSQILEIIFSCLEKDSVLVFLFGSFVGKKVFPSSDYDIGIISEEDISVSTLNTIKGLLNERVSTLRDIDIVDFSKEQNERFKQTALREVVIWHENLKLMPSFNRLKTH